jgi:hypothetical protein
MDDSPSRSRAARPPLRARRQTRRRSNRAPYRCARVARAARVAGALLKALSGGVPPADVAHGPRALLAAHPLALWPREALDLSGGGGADEEAAALRDAAWGGRGRGARRAADAVDALAGPLVVRNPPLPRLKAIFLSKRAGALCAALCALADQVGGRARARPRPPSFLASTGRVPTAGAASRPWARRSTRARGTVGRAAPRARDAHCAARRSRTPRTGPSRAPSRQSLTLGELERVMRRLASKESHASAKGYVLYQCYTVP